MLILLSLYMVVVIICSTLYIITVVSSRRVEKNDRLIILGIIFWPIAFLIAIFSAAVS